jgi:DNA polymerase III alpha subunit (gram-positive type)
MNKEIYISIDIETDGPCPGLNSMLSLGAVAFREGEGELGEFYANLELLPEAQPHPRTQTEFWSKFPEMYEATRQNTQDPAMVMKNFRSWVETLGGVPVAVAFPAGFDFSWIWYYSNRFDGGSPFSFSCIDMKTLAWVCLGGNYRHATKRNWPQHWFHPTISHNHYALDDAREQGYTFMKMLEHLRDQKSP